jgi:uncharacterized protein YndB with AHSA1/START domain
VSHHDGGRLRTDRRYPLGEGPKEAWDALARVDAYHRWWPWLRRFDAERLASGERWDARIRIPMPWSLRFSLHLRDVQAPVRVTADITGDIEGTATVTLEPVGDGAAIRLCSDLAPRHRLLRGVNRVVPGVSRRLHDRVVDRAFQQFAERDRSNAVER